MIGSLNLHGVWAIYRTEMARTRRTVWQSVATPVITTALYFIVFGGAIGSRMQQVGGIGFRTIIVQHHAFYFRGYFFVEHFNQFHVFGAECSNINLVGVHGI